MATLASKLLEAASLSASLHQELVEESILQAAAHAKLLQLGVQQHHQELDAKREALNRQHAALTDHGDRHGEILKLEAEMSTTHAALNGCVNTKKALSIQIEGADAARAEAKKMLADYLATKVKLKEALDDCRNKRDLAQKKLKRCLEHKEILKLKIKECNDKRSEARKKLAMCRKNKKELNVKMEEARRGLKKGHLLQSQHHAEMKTVSQARMDALMLLQESNSQYEEFVKGEADASAALKAAVEEQTLNNQEEHEALETLSSVSTTEADAAQMVAVIAEKEDEDRMKAESANQAAMNAQAAEKKPRS
eukprot:gnl/TRDRNA2_/TRDRNA2_89693_c1_seq1.p1 gnl/TRDRNA2_/TRDRNA2_89693_c1~~gnl/TRDRNA2_/TRDRNA2_89693_c1_seq1.p1  ORF type:complete len:309 (+),score=112.00 gnl/TRDRNA2_/TRDRNA2_89693_c1_seq1:2-928(+)